MISIKCRLCESKKLFKFLDLGYHPPSDQFKKKQELNEPTIYYPLEVYSCLNCGFKQLGYIVDPKTLYQSNYPYESSLTNEGITVVKRVGKIGEELTFTQKKSNISIGHTRWSTHGSPSQKNAHPHLSCNKKIAVVHNGIIENHEEIKLLLKNHTFKSDTDTEVVAHLIEEYMEDNSYRDAVLMAAKELKGSFALMILNKSCDKIIIGPCTHYQYQ